MSYAMTQHPARAAVERSVRQTQAHWRGFGAAAPATCGTNAKMGVDKACYCNPGFEWVSADSSDCAPVDVSKPCPFTGQRRNPVDKTCACPPGTIVNPDPSKFDCIPGYWFPHCLDATGNYVPGCVYGLPMSRALPLAAVGLGVGVALTLLVKALGG